MITRRELFARLGLGCLMAPLLHKLGGPVAEQVPEPQVESLQTHFLADDLEDGVTIYGAAALRSMIPDGDPFFCLNNDGDVSVR